MKRRFYIATIIIPVLILLMMKAGLSSQENINRFSKLSPVNATIVGPVLSVTPREIDLGSIGPGEDVVGSLTLKNFGSVILHWQASGPEGWLPLEKAELSGILGDEPDFLRIHLKSQDNFKESVIESELYPIQLNIELNNNLISFRKDLPAGTHREIIKLTSTGGTRNVFFTFRIVEKKSAPLLEVGLSRLDLGIIKQVGQVSRRLKLTNKGRNTLEWKVTIPENQDMELSRLPRPGRYVSFLNEEVKETGIYKISERLKDTISTSGRLLEENGYPSLYNKTDILKYKFSGTGITVFSWKNPAGGILLAYIDNKFINMDDCYDKQKKSADFLVAEGLPDGPHILTLVNSGGFVTIEGVKTYGRNVMKGPPGWIKVLPKIGATTIETDYVNLVINTQQLNSGCYHENVVIGSNGGEAVVEVALEVSADNIRRIIDVYRYENGFKYLYTTNPPAEADKIHFGGYTKRELVFRLFSHGTPGTTDFYRWYNPQTGDYFYSYDRSGGGKSLMGYIFEGAIGNIATSRLTDTRELYRWFNTSKGCHFYTTDPKGEGSAKRGYRFEGIAGYVK
ncbi:MAG: hypothetical protein WC560_03570 [Syntrophales bacterium]